MYFLDQKTVDDVVTKLVPVLFENYGDDMADFAYLGGDEGRGKLESALGQPKQTFYGEFLYPTIADKASTLLWSITKNHPFVDGNKRAALTAANLFLLMNAHILLATQAEAVSLCLRIAGKGDPIEREEVSDWLTERLVEFADPSLNDRVEQFFEEVRESDSGDAQAALNFLTKALKEVRKAL